MLLFGVQNLNAELARLRKSGFVVQKKRVPVAKILRRANQFCPVKAPSNLQSGKFLSPNIGCRMSNQRLFNERQKKILKLRDGNRCKACGTLTTCFQADHVIPYSKGGKTVLQNGQALCADCNLKKGNKMPEMDLREWQKAAHNKCLEWFEAAGNQKHFVINAAPGASKTICALCTPKPITHGKN